MKRIIAVVVYALIIAATYPGKSILNNIQSEKALRKAREIYAGSLDRMDADIADLHQCAARLPPPFLA